MDLVDYAHLLHFVIIVVEWVIWVEVFKRFKEERSDLVDWRLKTVKPILFSTILIKLSSSFVNDGIIIFLITPYFAMHLAFVYWFLKHLKNFDK